ncbi:eCIS core domain-containing protein, partial [Halomicrobium katesii]|uniref:eCIS core domain-containing protein n=1 Tax=Halomicrobium katesii TaxID=437163 RepID=UPI0005D20846
MTAIGATALTHRQHNIQRAMQDTGTSQDEVPDQVLDVVGSGGMPLERSVQDSLEDRMDADFSDVRIHTGAKAAEAADAIDAKAFTCGNAIVFNSGEYDPQSAEGQFLLAHELAHVKQQNGGAPLSMMPQENADLEIDPDPQLERQADQAAEEALQGDEPLTVNRLGT